jgi:hypothetical protein
MRGEAARRLGKVIATMRGMIQVETAWRVRAEASGHELARSLIATPIDVFSAGILHPNIDSDDRIFRRR